MSFAGPGLFSHDKFILAQLDDSHLPVNDVFLAKKRQHFCRREVKCKSWPAAGSCGMHSASYRGTQESHAERLIPISSADRCSIWRRCQMHDHDLTRMVGFRACGRWRWTLCTHCNQNKTDKRGTKGANPFIASPDLQTCTNHI